LRINSKKESPTVKTTKLRALAIFAGAFDNDNRALIPELWAQEGIAILVEQMVAARLVHRDFESEVAEFGDVVNTRKPQEFKAKRKVDADNVTVQDAVSVNVAVRLDQHVHVSFLIKDGERSKAFQDLITTYLEPAMIAMARHTDQIVLAQFAQFLNNSAGKLGDGASKNSLTRTRKVMNDNKVPQQTRYQTVTSEAETDYLEIDNFMTADKIGDDGTALREASLGKKFGIWLLLSQNMSDVVVGNTVEVGAEINEPAGYLPGETVLTVDGGVLPAVLQDGMYLTIEGDETPLRIASTTGSPVTEITLETGLKFPVANDAVITAYIPGEVNLVAGYAGLQADGTPGYAKEIVVDGFTVAPQVGQLVSFGTGVEKYVIIDVNGLTGITLDRPLETAIANDDNVNIGPAGNYNFTFHRNCLSLVTRPLEAAMAGTGASSAVVNDELNNVGLRVTITYDGNKQGHLVTLDFLAGVKVLDEDLGAVMLS
jgi:hypothetical protein